MTRLSVQDHSRDSAGLTYIYPVLSRRAGGLSIGVNLNINNACNWRCVYCQVPDLGRGGPPPVDLDLLHRELDGFLDYVLDGDFFEHNKVTPEQRAIRDIAFSGNGEPTSAKEFPEAVAVVKEVMQRRLAETEARLVLISNGSLVHLPRVQQGLASLPPDRGEMWFKLDSATEAGLDRINGAALSAAKVQRNLVTAAGLCTVWIQTCLFAFDGEPPSKAERQAYLDLLRDVLDGGSKLAGVLMYGLARQSYQPEAPRLAALPAAWLEDYAESVRALGLKVRVAP